MHCPSCSSSAVLYDHVRGESVCTRCGFVILDRLFDLEPEWRRKPGEKLERADVTTGIDVTQHDLGLGSKFSVPRDASPSHRARLRRMRVLHQRSRVSSWEDRSLREALVELDKLCEDLAIPKGIKAEVSVSYRRARAKRITAGRSLHQVLAVLVFITCRARGLPRTEDEISRALVARVGTKKHRTTRNFRKLVKLLAKELEIKLPRISTDDYIIRFVPQLGLSKEAVECAHNFHKTLPKNFQSKSPIFLAAVSLYIGADSTGEKVTLQKVARVVGVGISSLSKNVVRARQLAAKE